jgi:predicted nucleic acid-binding protein
MHKLQIYLDTSVMNFVLADDITEEVREITKRLCDEVKRGKYEGYISAQVLIEIMRAPQEKAEQLLKFTKTLDVEELPFSQEADELAAKYVAEGIIPVKYKEDAIHLAIASVNKLDVVVSWNFKHIVKLKTKQGVTAVNALLGYKPIEIVSPQEVIDDV